VCRIIACAGAGYFCCLRSLGLIYQQLCHGVPFCIKMPFACDSGAADHCFSANIGEHTAIDLENIHRDIEVLVDIVLV